MFESVPDDQRNAALRALWGSSEIISKPDDLDDFLEDFREEAMSLPPELARSAYRVGAGFMEHESSVPDSEKYDHGAEQSIQNAGMDKIDPYSENSSGSPKPGEPIPERGHLNADTSVRNDDRPEMAADSEKFVGRT